MNKTYQPFIIKYANFLILGLENTKFFEEEEIISKDFTREILCDRLTEKFLMGELFETDSPYDIFNDDEFFDILNSIVMDNALNGLIEKGFLNSIEDENNEINYFLTEDGKKLGKKLIEDGHE